MLIVAFSMMFAALLIFLLWNLFIKCRAPTPGEGLGFARAGTRRRYVLFTLRR